MVHFFSGLILMVISFVMGLIPATVSANSYLKVWVLLISWPPWALKRLGTDPFFLMLLQNFFRLSPGFCFSDGLASLALLRQGMKDKSSHGVFDWNVTGASIFYLGLEVRGLPFLNLFVPTLLNTWEMDLWLSVNDFIFVNLEGRILWLLLCYTKIIVNLDYMGISHLTELIFDRVYSTSLWRLGLSFCLFKRWCLSQLGSGGRILKHSSKVLVLVLQSHFSRIWPEPFPLIWRMT